MAEYCKDCAASCLGLSGKDMERAVFSKDPDLCEGCGQWKPVLIRIKPTITETIKRKLTGGRR